MQKIPTLFKRDPENPRYVTDEINEGCEWVLAGEGIATRKYDGTCVMFDGKRWWARREVKSGGIPPANFVAVNYDEVTDKTMGYEPIEQSSFYKFLMEALAHAFIDGDYDIPKGTYELCGPKINRDPEGFGIHELVRHETAQSFPRRDDAGPLTYDLIKNFILTQNAMNGMEGIVWHHPDGRMAKLKARDLKS